MLLQYQQGYCHHSLPKRTPSLACLRIRKNFRFFFLIFYWLLFFYWPFYASVHVRTGVANVNKISSINLQYISYESTRVGNKQRTTGARTHLLHNRWHSFCDVFTSAMRAVPVHSSIIITTITKILWLWPSYVYATSAQTEPCGVRTRRVVLFCRFIVLGLRYGP